MNFTSPSRPKWELKLALQYKIGFIGTGNLAQAMIKGLIENEIVEPKNIFGANRSAGKLQKLQESYGIQACATNEELIESCDIVILAMKPQDLPSAVESLSSIFSENQIVISLAAGVTLRSLERMLSEVRLVRLIPNTPSLISRGVIGYVTHNKDEGLEATIEDLFRGLGYVLKVEDEDQLAALTVSCSSGTGFVFELMMYWQDWIEERGFPPEIARKMTVETFLGAAMLASQSDSTELGELLAKVASKKGITAAGLQSMRELEIERALRYSFEKASLRNQELAKES